MQMRKTNPAAGTLRSIAPLVLSRRDALLGTLAGAASLAVGTSARSETRAWPTKPVRLVTFGPPGAAPDLAARIWSEKLSALWRQPVIVDNKPGGDGIIAAQAMLAARDGHTLFFGPSFIYAALHHTNHDIAIRPIDEMVPICGTNIDFLGVAVSRNLPVSSLAELQKYTHAKPDTLNWYAPTGSLAWLLLSDFISKMEARMLFVPYRGAPQAIIDLIEDRLHVAAMPLAPLISQAEAGKVRLIATLGTRRPTAAAEIQTAAEQGFADMTVEGLFGFYGPRSIPVELVEQIGADVSEVSTAQGMGPSFERIGQSLKPLSKAGFTAELMGYERKAAELVKRYKIKRE